MRQKRTLDAPADVLETRQLGPGQETSRFPRHWKTADVEAPDNGEAKSGSLRLIGGADEAVSQLGELIGGTSRPAFPIVTAPE